MLNPKGARLDARWGVGHQLTSAPLCGRKATNASVNQLTFSLRKAGYALSAIATEAILHPAAGGNHARQPRDSNLCSVDNGTSAARLIVFWGRRPRETLQHLETSGVHDRGYRQQAARKCVRHAGGGLSHVYGCWSRVRIRDHETR